MLLTRASSTRTDTLVPDPTLFRSVFRIPLFQYQVKAKEPIALLSQVVMCNTMRGDFRANGEALIRENDTFELVVIDEGLSDRLILGTSTVNAYSARALIRSEEHTSELQSLMRI